MGSGLLRYHRNQREAAAKRALAAKEVTDAADAMRAIAVVEALKDTPSTLDAPRRLLTRTKTAEPAAQV